MMKSLYKTFSSLERAKAEELKKKDKDRDSEEEDQDEDETFNKFVKKNRISINKEVEPIRGSSSSSSSSSTKNSGKDLSKIPKRSSIRNSGPKLRKSSDSGTTIINVKRNPVKKSASAKVSKSSSTSPRKTKEKSTVKSSSSKKSKTSATATATATAAAPDNTLYVVESILDYLPKFTEKTMPLKSQLRFLVKWHGYREAESTWEPWSYLHKLIVMNDFIRRHPELKKPLGI